MKIFPQELSIGDREGFTPEKDIFARAELGKGLTNLVSNVSEPIVLALDGKWGTGKTTFLKMWAGELRKNNFPVIYFDAFENDFSDDAFAALASQVVEIIDEIDTGKSDKFVKEATAVGKILGGAAIKIA
ncbi:MAG: hypothetical protein JKY32_01945, partial [Rhizobiales bacterium]|nr:hypothetical protein [Hyphomicrobiales bacterium]